MCMLECASHNLTRQYSFEIISYKLQVVGKTYKTFPPWQFPSIMFNYYLHHWIFPTYFQFFHTSREFPIFPSFPVKKSRWEWVGKGKHSVFIYRFLSFFPASGRVGSFWQLFTLVFWEVQGISSTPRLISPLEKSHGIVFNLALSCSGFPCHISPCLYHIPFMCLQRTMVSIRFLYVFEFFPASGQVGWSWQLPALIFEECRASPIPLE